MTHTSDGEIQKRRAEMLSVDAYRNAKVEFKTIGGDRLARLDVKGTDRVFFTFIDGKWRQEPTD